MEKMRRILKSMVVLMGLCLAFVLSMQVSAANRVTIPDRAVRSGKNVYFTIGHDYWGGSLYRYNISSGKKTMIVKGSCKQISLKGSYLYFTIDKYAGSDGQNQYIYRVKTNGKGLKKLAAGYSPVLIGNYIYYLATAKGNNYGGSGPLCDETVKGIYRMKLDGSGQKCIYSVDSSQNSPWESNLYKISGNRLVLTYYENGKVITTSGKNYLQYTLNTNVLSNTDKERGEFFTLTASNNSKNYSFSSSGSKLYRTANGKKKCILKFSGSETIQKIIDLNGYLWVVTYKSSTVARIYLVKDNGKGKKLLHSSVLAG